MREPDRLYAEAVSNNFLDGPLLLTLADEEVMSDAGWRPPADPAPRNWWTELPEAGAVGGMLSVTDGDYSRLADVMVTALRDVQGVRRPSDLVYESFHRHGTGLIELLDFGIDVADASRVNKRRATSSADADLLEPRLAEAKANGDNTTYFSLLESADLVLPASASAVEDPDRAEFPTITIGGDTYVTVFTSPGRWRAPATGIPACTAARPSTGWRPAGRTRVAGGDQLGPAQRGAARLVRDRAADRWPGRAARRRAGHLEPVRDGRSARALRAEPRRRWRAPSLNGSTPARTSRTTMFRTTTRIPRSTRTRRPTSGRLWSGAAPSPRRANRRRPLGRPWARRRTSRRTVSPTARRRTEQRRTAQHLTGRPRRRDSRSACR